MPRWISFSLISGLFLLMSMTVIAQDTNAQIINMADILNVRSEPSGRATVITQLAGNTAVNVIARISTNRWYQVTTSDGSVTGWIASDFVDLNIERSDIPIITAPVTPISSSTDSSNTTTTVTVDIPAGAPVGDARVNVITANVRASASTGSAVLTQLSGGTVVSIIARNSSTTWIRVQLADARVGWVFASLLEFGMRRSDIPIVDGNATVSNNDATTTGDSSVTIPSGDAPYFTLGASAPNIFATGQALGNRANVFSKIGDSITVAEEAFGPFGFGVYNLGDYSYLRSTISFFSAQARNNNSFNNTSLAARNGFTTASILNSEFANPAVCLHGESPLACEYRLTRPAVAIILLGTNDTTHIPIDQFAQNMRVIADYSIANGVIPVLTSIPPRLHIPGRAEAYNQLILDVAQERGLPFLDFYGALVTLPDSGMNPDGIHPSTPPLGFEQGADFRGNNLQYGYVMRNLTVLQALHVLHVEVLR